MPVSTNPVLISWGKYAIYRIPEQNRHGVICQNARGREFVEIPNMWGTYKQSKVFI